METDPNKPPAGPGPGRSTAEADAARHAIRAARLEAMRGRGAAREALNAALDRLGDKLPTAAEAVELAMLADRAFEPQSAAGRLFKILWALAARGPARGT